jgi:hypothetical protein
MCILTDVFLVLQPYKKIPEFIMSSKPGTEAGQKNIIHGIAGLVVLLISQILLFRNNEPIATWFYFFAWWPYIFIVDSIIYRIKQNSLIINRKKEFFLMLFWSVAIWTFFEAVNLIMQNWYYINVLPFRTIRWIGYAVAYATVLPGIFETTELLEAAGFLKKSRVKPLSVNLGHLTVLVIMGFISMVGVLLYPRYCFPLIWGSLIFLLEPINYLKGGKSLLRDWEQGTARKFYLLLFAGLICGILWEFWNFWARTKWIYTVPFFEELKLFEMPLAGFLGFPPFAVQCYVIYNFISLFRYNRGWEEDNYRLNQGKRVSFILKAFSFLAGLIFCLSTFSAMDMITVSSYWPQLQELKTIPSKIVARLSLRDITTPRGLLSISATNQQQAELAKELNVSVGEVVRWKNIAELAELKGMGTSHANLLVQAGIDSVSSLAEQTAGILYPTLLIQYREKSMASPREAILKIWIREAKKALQKN